MRRLSQQQLGFLYLSGQWCTFLSEGILGLGATVGTLRAIFTFVTCMEMNDSLEVDQGQRSLLILNPLRQVHDHVNVLGVATVNESRTVKRIRDNHIREH